jgi:alpha-D-xyloside xylohydrolase
VPDHHARWPRLAGHRHALLVDFTHPGAYAFWRDSHRPLFELGVDMIKPDLGEQIEDDCLAHNGDQGQRLHNVYPLLYNRCVHEAAERYRPSGSFLFSRSAWAGSQRYPGQWGGDQQADFEVLSASPGRPVLGHERRALPRP